MTVLYYHCKNRNISGINDRLKNASYSDINDGMYGACIGGHMDVALLMIEKGSDHWDTGLLYAFFGGHMNLAYLMIEKGANIKNCGFIPNFDNMYHLFQLSDSLRTKGEKATLPEEYKKSYDYYILFRSTIYNNTSQLLLEDVSKIIVDY